MRSHTLYRLSMAAVLAMSLAACGVGKRQSPVASDDESAGEVRPVQIEDDKPVYYITQAGDTLRGIAGRDEIYAEPDLWPLLLDANNERLGEQDGRSALAAGINLMVPRGLDEAALDDAREKALQFTAATKVSSKPKRVKAPVMALDDDASERSPRISTKREAKSPTVAPTAVPTVKADLAPKPVPKAKKSGGLMPVLLFLLFLLAALAAVLYYFTRRDQKDGEA